MSYPFDNLMAFEESGSLQQFMEYMDSDEGKDWLDAIYGNYLIRRDTVREVAFQVIRRELKRVGDE